MCVETRIGGSARNRGRGRTPAERRPGASVVYGRTAKLFETIRPPPSITTQMTASGVQQPSSDVLRRAAEGDLDAFAWIYRQYHKVVYRFARVMVGSVDAAEDVTQEVFVALLADLDRYDPQRAAFSTYLYGIVRNLTRERLRRDARFFPFDGVSAPDSEAPVTGPVDHLEDAELAGQVRRALRGLAASEREVVVLCDLHGLSYAEAAAVVGASVPAVRSRLHRGRQLLRRRLRRLVNTARGGGFGSVRCAFGGTS